MYVCFYGSGVDDKYVVFTGGCMSDAWLYCLLALMKYECPCESCFAMLRFHKCYCMIVISVC